MLAEERRRKEGAAPSAARRPIHSFTCVLRGLM
jgi:hypothetical protein